MDELINYKLKDFLKQPEELIESYMLYLKALEPTDSKKSLLESAKLKHIDALKTSQFQDFEYLVKIIARLQSARKKDILNMKILEFYPLLLSLQIQFENILKMEQSLVPEHVDEKWEMIEGSKFLQPFGIYNTLQNLSGGDILKWKKIYNLPYLEVFMKLKLDTVTSNLQYKMSQIKTKTPN